MTLTWLYMGILGLIAGSFANAVAWRVHSGQKLWPGRSQCPGCGHELGAKDLVPVFSWLALKQKCRYCQKPISFQYPLVEIIMALVFALSYIWWPGGLHNNQDWLMLGTWLASSVGLMALAISDVCWLLLPNHILYPTLFIAAAGKGLDVGLYSANITHALTQWLLAVLVASGFFWTLYTVSRGKWIGYGDVRLGLIIGTLVAGPQESVATIIIAAGIGAAIAIPLLATGRKHLGEKLAFGPLLILATWLVVLFGESIIDWYRQLLT